MKNTFLTALTWVSLTFWGCDAIVDNFVPIRKDTSNQVHRTLEVIDNQYLDSLYQIQLQNWRTIKDIDENAENLLINNQYAMPVVVDLFSKNGKITENNAQYLDLYLIYSTKEYTDTNISRDLKELKNKKDEN